ncbi:hypothetical protein ANN_18185 [Periplaneta americana]|uniref:Uncharacterized protein n=1 Tax=Periplaneta americana TaxID=6978 RepID=A0ABQ8SN17_PERAM|nr:hypothetical protein ANN_18185 [Periplaneta americana]
MDLREVRFDDRDWIYLAGLCEGGNEPPGSLKASDNAGEMSPGSESYPAFTRIGLRENPGKNLNQVTCPNRDSNPGHLVSQPDVLTVTPQCTSRLSRDENIVRNGNIKIGNVSFEEVEKFKYLGATVTNEESTARMMDVTFLSKMNQDCQCIAEDI